MIYHQELNIELQISQLKGAVPLETADRGVMLCIYFSFSLQCTLTLLLQLKQTPTDSSYKPSFKKKDRPGTEKQRYKPYGYSAIQGQPLQL